MEYFKCHWCGSTHNRYEPLCPNCGGTLDHKSDVNKSRFINQKKKDIELIKMLKNIPGMLVLICVTLVVLLAYFLFDRTFEVVDEVPTELIDIVNEVPIEPIGNQSITITHNNVVYKRKFTDIKKKPDVLAKKINHCVLDFDKRITPNVYLVSSYKGLQASKLQFGNSGHEVKESEVIVNKPGEKIILVLMAYDPVVWKIKKTFDSSVTGVILAGYHEQVITGLPKTTPILEAIYENKTKCKYFYDSVKAGGQNHSIAKRIEDIVGSRPTEYITSPFNGKFYIGNTSLKSPLIGYSNTINQSGLGQQLKEKGYTIDTVPPNEEGLIYLLNQGNIRVASASDIDNWSLIASQHSTSGIHRMQLGLTYVILKKMQFPRGMYGAHSRAFILNKNVPIPTGNRGHNTIYLMKGGACLGATCLR